MSNVERNVAGLGEPRPAALRRPRCRRARARAAWQVPKRGAARGGWRGGRRPFGRHLKAPRGEEGGGAEEPGQGGCEGDGEGRGRGVVWDRTRGVRLYARVHTCPSSASGGSGEVRSPRGVPVPASWERAWRWLCSSGSQWRVLRPCPPPNPSPLSASPLVSVPVSLFLVALQVVWVAFVACGRSCWLDARDRADEGGFDVAVGVHFRQGRGAVGSMWFRGGPARVAPSSLGPRALGAR